MMGVNSHSGDTQKSECLSNVPAKQSSYTLARLAVGARTFLSPPSRLTGCPSGSSRHRSFHLRAISNNNADRLDAHGRVDRRSQGLPQASTAHKHAPHSPHIS